MDSVLALDEGAQALFGMRTSENAAYIAAKNKKLQLAIRANDREARLTGKRQRMRVGSS